MYRRVIGFAAVVVAFSCVLGVGSRHSAVAMAGVTISIQSPQSPRRVPRPGIVGSRRMQVDTGSSSSQTDGSKPQPLSVDPNRQTTTQEAAKAADLQTATKPVNPVSIQSNKVRNSATGSSTSTSPRSRKPVDLRGILMQPIRLQGDSSAIAISGNVIIHHNGAVITCDSAVRYSASKFMCFNNVVINQKSTYIYGDRAEYDGASEVANVFAPIVKIVDKDATMYTYDFSFNTQTKVGKYTSRGTMSQKDNLLESQSGYYYTETRTLVCVKDVQLRNNDYSVQSDSLSYNLDTEVAEFFVRSYIWNKSGEILSALKGVYDRKVNTYHFNDHAYALTTNQELWADTIDYNNLTEDAVLRSNIQILDKDYKVLSFGDYGLYWGKPQNAMLTKNPSAISFDPKEDSLFMRADSMFLYTISRDSALMVLNINKEPESEEEQELIDPVSDPAVDSAVDSADLPGRSRSDRRRGVPESTVGIAADSTLSKEVALEQTDKTPEKQSRAQKRKQRRDERNSSVAQQDTLATLPKSDSSGGIAGQATQSAGSMKIDSLSIKIDSAAVVKDTIPPDSLVRMVKAYRNVKIFRSDVQAVCDSLVGFSIDSTLHMYINPVMWNGENQIKSNVIDLFTVNQQIHRALFSGEPIMSSRVDSTRYNQVKGKTIEALFRENEIYRTNVDGNGQTLYYMTEEDSLGSVDVVGFLVADCGSITFDIDNKEVDRIVYKADPIYAIYPIDKIPVEQQQTLPGFIWEAHRKPLKEDVFSRTILPSQREEYEQRPKPLFPMTESIMSHRETMIKDGIWRDRNDILSSDVIHYLNTLNSASTITP